MPAQSDIDRDALLDQHRVLARFGELALASEKLDEILTEACRLVGDALRTDFAKVVEVQPDRRTLLVRAGVGWRPGIVGQTRTDLDEATPEGLTLRDGAPVVSPDLAREDRFKIPPFVAEHGVRATVCVPIVLPDGDPPYGVLQVDACEPRPFGEAEVAFLRTYANMLASAVSRLRTGAELRRRAEDNERLFRELQHRVKNNLQVMVGLVEVQARRERAPAAKAALRAVGRRVEALRLLHDTLHLAGEVDRVDLGNYLGQLAAGLLRFHESEASRIRLVLEVERGMITSVDAAAPLGLVVNEFVTNSLKHAFGEGPGTVHVRLAPAGAGTLRLELSDDGSGLPQGTAAGAPAGKAGAALAGTGMRMIGSLARQLGAAAEWSTAEGGRGARLALTVHRPPPPPPNGEA
ncbi:MAG TPA: histidine kinase dimerization/phosphoacceptor domain -containing protein [Falsiroseomonas sp.]|jgi:two-component sensor histidine kinase|nr:histidine kinase dimerization/phosphoacceptor domain -containing protein [Falsiroseomonas sp.]